MDLITDNTSKSGEPGQQLAAAASAFIITTATANVALDGAHQASASFTVTNSSGRALRGQAQVVAEPAEAQPWFQLEGSAERDFPVGSTEQFVVHINVPPGTPAGQCKFHLKEIGVANPDEDFAVGPSIAFDISASPAPVPPPPPFPWWIVAVAAAVILVIGAIIAYFVFFREPAVTTPPASTTFADVTLSNVKVNGGSNVAKVAPGATVSVSLTYAIKDAGCPGCVDQIEVGFTTLKPVTCVYSGVPGAAGVTSAGTFTVTAPTGQGVYYLGFDRAQDYGCTQAVSKGNWWNSPPDASRQFAAIVVQ